METTAQDSGEPEVRQNRLRLFVGQLSWRMILMRLVINGLTLILVAVLVPDIYFVDRTLLSVLLMAAALGILNAVVKPIVQFLTLPFIFATFGFVVVLINTIMLLLLAAIFEERFYVGRLIWAIVGGLVMGIVSSFLESLLGLNLPIVPKSELPEGSGGLSGAGSNILSNILVDEPADEEEPAFNEDVSEPAEAASSLEPSVAAAAGTGEEISESTSDEEPEPSEDGDPGEAQEGADGEQQGDER